MSLTSPAGITVQQVHQQLQHHHSITGAARKDAGHITHSHLAVQGCSETPRHKPPVTGQAELAALHPTIQENPGLHLQAHTATLSNGMGIPPALQWRAFPVSLVEDGLLRILLFARLIPSCQHASSHASHVATDAGHFVRNTLIVSQRRKRAGGKRRGAQSQAKGKKKKSVCRGGYLGNIAGGCAPHHHKKQGHDGISNAWKRRFAQENILRLPFCSEHPPPPPQKHMARVGSQSSLFITTPVLHQGGKGRLSCDLLMVARVPFSISAGGLSGPSPARSRGGFATTAGSDILTCRPPPRTSLQPHAG